MKYTVRNNKGKVIGKMKSPPVTKDTLLTDDEGGSHKVEQIWQDRALGEGTLYVRQNGKKK